MGFDKPDLGFVVHLGAPPSPIAYYQQVGRAGRAVEHAEVLLLPGRGGRGHLAVLRLARVPARGAGTRRSSTRSPPRTVHCRRPALETAGRTAPHPARDDAQGPRRRRRGPPGQGRLGVDRRSRGRYDAARLRPGRRRAREPSSDAMRTYAVDRRMPDGVPATAPRRPGCRPCGRCDNCAGRWYPTEVSPTRARRRAGAPGPGRAWRSRRARQWPTGLAAIGVPLSGKIPAGEQTEPGRAIGRLSDLGWGDRLRRVAGDTAPDQPIPDDVLKGAVDTLAAWARGEDRWATRPAGVVVLGSRHRPALVASIGERIAAIGRLPLLGTVTPATNLAANPAPVAAGRANSAQRVRALHAAFAVPDELRSALATARRAGAARRRPGRQRLDDGPGRSATAAGRRAGCAAVRPRDRRLTQTPASS